MVMLQQHNYSKREEICRIQNNATIIVLYIGDAPEYFREPTDNGNVSVIAVNNSLQAMNLLRSGTMVHAIVCEYFLPGKNGLFLFEQVRLEAAFDRLPFVMLCTQFDEALFRAAYRKKVDDFFVTSVTSCSKLIRRIRTLCEYRNHGFKANIATNCEHVYVMPFSKRLFDVVAASLALLLFSPVLLIAIMLIRLESKGKVYYISKRVGRTVFDFYKLRSMRSGADHELKKLAKEKNQYNSDNRQTEICFDIACPRCSKLLDEASCSPIIYIDKKRICEYWYNLQKREITRQKSPFVKIADDPRVTRIGKFIRNTSIDELPQLINVLKGDMSIVGNRPLPVYEAELLTVDTLSKRFLAPAGITGLWQVELRGRGGKMSEEERKRLDNEYADHFRNGNYSFWYDMKLILRTIPALFQKNSV